jgi:hypothetical protein
MAHLFPSSWPCLSSMSPWPHHGPPPPPRHRPRQRIGFPATSSPPASLPLLGAAAPPSSRQRHSLEGVAGGPRLSRQPRPRPPQRRRRQGPSRGARRSIQPRPQRRRQQGPRRGPGHACPWQRPCGGRSREPAARTGECGWLPSLSVFPCLLTGWKDKGGEGALIGAPTRLYPRFCYFLLSFFLRFFPIRDRIASPCRSSSLIVDTPEGRCSWSSHLPASPPLPAVVPLAAGHRRAGARSASAPPAILVRTPLPMSLKEDVVATPALSATAAALRRRHPCPKRDLRDSCCNMCCRHPCPECDSCSLRRLPSPSAATVLLLSSASC